jgi:hypothetical protein
LLKHPLLVIELGFQLVTDPSAPYGFDCQRTLPSEQWLREKLRTFDQDLLQALLAATVADLKEAIPDLGETIACDVKHIAGLGAREQSQCLRQRRLQCDPHSQRRS